MMPELSSVAKARAVPSGCLPVVSSLQIQTLLTRCALESFDSIAQRPGNAVAIVAGNCHAGKADSPITSPERALLLEF